MSNRPNLDQEQLIQSVYLHAAEMMKHKMSTHDMEQILMRRGLKAEVASAVIKNLRNAQRKALRNVGLKHMGIGGAVSLIGLVITIGTLQAAQDGGHSIIAWGAIVFGGLQFLRGLAQFVIYL